MHPKSASSPTIYLLRETALIALFSYFLLIGGTLNGLIRLELNLISHALLIALFGLWMARVLRRREGLPASSLDRPVLAFLIALAVTAILSTDPRRSLGNLGLTVVYALVFLLLRDLLRRDWPAELLTKCLLIVGGIVIGLGVAEIAGWYAGWLSIGGLAQLVPPVLFRLHSILGHANTLANFLNLLIPLALMRLITGQRLWPRLLLVGWLAAAFVALFFTSSRGGWLGGAAGLVTVAVLLGATYGQQGRDWLLARWRWWQARPWAMILAAGAALAASGGLAWLGLRIVHHPTHVGLVAARQWFWATAWRAFLSSPWWGTGPFTFGSQLMKYNPTPPHTPYGNAHSYPFTIAAEMGLIGLVAVAWLVCAIAIALARTWRQADRSRRLVMIGPLAGLAATAVHNLFDNLLGMPTIVITVMIVLTVALEPRPSPAAPRRRSPLWALVPGLVLIASALWTDVARWSSGQGVRLANAGRWSEAVPLLDRATRQDPYLAFYRFQAGYAHGRLAAGNGGDDHLAPAIAHYRAGLRLDPEYSLNYANLSVLYWQAGQSDQAITAMQEALALSTQVSLYHLNLGYEYEALGREEEALAAYTRALDTASGRAEALYWQQTPLRQRALADWQAAHPPPPLPPSPQTIDDYLRLGWHALDSGQPTEALDVFRQVLALDETSLSAYHGLAVAQMDLGQYAEAERALRMAFSLPIGNPEERLYPLLTWGQLARRQGRLEEAIAHYELALGMVYDYNVYGYGTFGWSPYGWNIFQRESLQSDLLPQWVRADLTPELVARFEELAQWYEEAGESDKAARIRDFLQKDDALVGPSP